MYIFLQTDHRNRLRCSYLFYANVCKNFKWKISLLLFRNRIVAVCAPWMTAGYPLCAKPDTFDDAPFLNGFNSIMRT